MFLTVSQLTSVAITNNRRLYYFCFREIVTYDAQEKKRTYFFSTHTFRFNLEGTKITCIFITNMISYKKPFYVTLIDGGIGKSFVILKLKSGWNHELLARITLYGYPGRYYVSGPTQPLLRKTEKS